MTTKKYSADPFRFTFLEGLKSAAAAPALLNAGAFLIATLLLPLYLLRQAETEVIGNGVSETAKLGARGKFTYLFMPYSDVLSIVMIVFVVIFSIFAAIFTFRFITSKKTVNVYYSLGITRERLYFSKYLSGLTLMALSIILPFLGSLIVNISFLGSSPALIKAFFFYMLTYLAIAFVSFSIAAAVFSSVGTMFEAAVFTVILLFLPTIFFYCLQALMNVYVYGNPYGVSFLEANSSLTFTKDVIVSLTESFSFLSPLFFAKSGLMMFGSLDRSGKENLLLSGDFGTTSTVSGSPDLLPSLLWLIAALGIALLGMWIFKKRRAEICGFIGTNRVLNSVGIFILGFFALCVSVSMLQDFTWIALAVGAGVFAVIYIVLSLLLLRDVKKFLRGLWRLPAQLGVSALILALFATGLFGFASKAPALSSVKSAKVTFGGMGDEYAISTQFGNLDRNSNFMNTGALVNALTTEGDIEKALSLQKLAMVKADSDSATTNTVQFVYTLKDGRTFARSYSCVSTECYSALSLLESTDFYRERLKEVFTGAMKEADTEADEAPSGTVTDLNAQSIFQAQQLLRGDTSTVTVLSSLLTTSKDLSLTTAQQQDLTTALYNDLQKRTAQQKYTPNERPLLFLNFFCVDTDLNGNEKYEAGVSEPVKTAGQKSATSAYHSLFSLIYHCDGTCDDSGNDYQSMLIAVTKDMAETTALLEKFGVMEKLSETADFNEVTLISASSFSERINTKSDLNANYQYSWLKSNMSRLFLGSYLDDNDATNSLMYEFVSEGKKITDRAMIAELLKKAQTVYENPKNQGWYLVFNGDSKKGTGIYYLPAASMPEDVAAIMK